MRLITKIRHAKPISKHLKLLTAIDIYIMECALFVKNNQSLFENFQFAHGYNTINKDNLVSMQTTKAFIDGGVLNTCIRIYNTLAKEVKQLPSTVFKKML